MKKLLFALCLVTFALAAFADEASAARRFEAAKRSDPELIAFLKRMPKGADLHNHVTGAVYSDFLLDNAIQRSLFFDPATAGFANEAGTGRVPASDLLRNDEYLYSFLNKVSMRGWIPNTIDGHDHFFSSFDTIGTAMQGMTTDDLLVEVAKRNLAQNVQYLELMTRVAPGEALAPVVNTKVDLDDYVAAFESIRPGLRSLRQAIPGYMDARERNLSTRLGVPLGDVRSPIALRYIFSLNRLVPNEEFFVWAAAAMACVEADPRVVAINMVAPEDHPNSRHNFDTQMKILDFLWRRLGRPNVTLHAGELTLKYSPVEPMRDRIRKSIQVGHARRIGHGVSVAWEDDLPGLLAMMKREGILVEVCLSSNASILGVSDRQHPFTLYRAAGVPVCLNTDDEGVSRSNLTMEWLKGVRSFGLSYRDLKEMARNAIEYSFLSGPSLYVSRDYSKLRPGWEGVRRSDWRPPASYATLGARHEKLARQIRLERAFVEFER